MSISNLVHGSVQRRGMLPSSDFDDEPPVQTNEIEDTAVARNLPAKVKAACPP
jgi:hypothetical protein